MHSVVLTSFIIHGLFINAPFAWSTNTSLLSHASTDQAISFANTLIPLNPSSFLLGAGFATGALLWWALAGLIPIALHLWFQRQRREVTWAAMQFLVSALQKQSRRIRLQQMLLLLLRVAILITLAIAAAQPFLNSTSSAWMGLTRPPLLWVGVLDTSYSMQYRDSTRQSRWEQAIARARNQIEQLQPGDGIILISLSNPPRVLFSEVTFDRTTALLELDKLSPSDSGSDLNATLALLEQTLKANRQSHPELTASNIIFYTDAAGEAWNTAPSSATQSALRNISKDSLLQLDLVGDRKAENLAVTEFKLDPSTPQLNSEVTLLAEVANLSPDTSLETSVQLNQEGQTTQSQPIQLSPRERKQVRFQQKLSDTRNYRLEAVLPEDGLAIDDRRHLVVSPQAEANILLLEDLPGQAKYIALALATDLSGKAAASSRYSITTAKLEDWQDIDLQNMNLLVLCNISSFPEQFPELLRDFVKRGGNLLVFLGDRINPQAYAALQQDRDSLGSLLPFNLAQPSPLSLYVVDPRDYSSPYLQAFKNFPESGLITTPIFRYWQIDPKPPSIPNATIDLATENGNPLLVNVTCGNGKALWWLTAPTPLPASVGDREPWNAMGAWPSFLPLIREQVAFLTRPSDSQTSRLVNETLQGYLPPNFTGSQITIARPDGKTELVRIGTPQNDGFRPWQYDENNLVGFYECQSTEPLPAAFSVFAVNPDTQESDLVSDGAQKYRTWFTPFDDSAVTANPSGEASLNGSPTPASVTQRMPIFHWLLFTLLGLLLTESIVALTLGRLRL